MSIDSEYAKYGFGNFFTYETLKMLGSSRCSIAYTRPSSKTVAKIFERVYGVRLNSL